MANEVFARFYGSQSHVYVQLATTDESKILLRRCDDMHGGRETWWSANREMKIFGRRNCKLRATFIWSLRSMHAIAERCDTSIVHVLDAADKKNCSVGNNKEMAPKELREKPSTKGFCTNRKKKQSSSVNGVKHAVCIWHRISAKPSSLLCALNSGIARNCEKFKHWEMYENLETNRGIAQGHKMEPLRCMCVPFARISQKKKNAEKEQLCTAQAETN